MIGRSASLIFYAILRDIRLEIGHEHGSQPSFNRDCHVHDRGGRARRKARPHRRALQQLAEATNLPKSQIKQARGSCAVAFRRSAANGLSALPAIPSNCTEQQPTGTEPRHQPNALIPCQRRNKNSSARRRENASEIIVIRSPALRLVPVVHRGSRALRSAN